MEDLDTLRAIPITTILKLAPTKRRVSIRCVFPNHNDSSPSLVLYPDNSFNCFGCGANGQNAIDFAIALGYSTKDAIRELKDYI